MWNNIAFCIKFICDLLCCPVLLDFSFISCHKTKKKNRSVKAFNVMVNTLYKSAIIHGSYPSQAILPCKKADFATKYRANSGLATGNKRALEGSFCSCVMDRIMFLCRVISRGAE